jgi:hypothetical protein
VGILRQPEVEEHDPAAGLHEDVPGMRVGVEEAVDEDLLAVDLDEPLRDAGGETPSARSPSTSVTRTPGAYSVTSTRALECERMTSGTSTSACPWRWRRMRSALDASFSKSSSSGT